MFILANYLQCLVLSKVNLHFFYKKTNFYELDQLSEEVTFPGPFILKTLNQSLG